MDYNLEEQPAEDKIPWYKGPLRTIMGLFILLLIILWIVPHYGIKQNPEPRFIPSLSDLDIADMPIPNTSSADIRTYVQTNPEIKRLADKIITLSCSETSRICNAKALFYFVRDNFNYVNDPLAFEYYKTPQESLKSEGGGL